MKVILISGKAGSGKDTTARFIEEALLKEGYSVKTTHFGDLVKYICREYFDWDGQKDEKGRTMLQTVGTDIVRKQDPDYWARFIADVALFFNNRWDYLLVPDLRFPNELEQLKSRLQNAYHLRVLRPQNHSKLTEKQQLHISETALDDIEPDYTIYNRGSLEELKNAAIDILTKIKENN